MRFTNNFGIPEFRFLPDRLCKVL